MAEKKNQSAHEIDLTSFAFATSACGKCHPGGGPLELDRDGRRYDKFASESANGISSGGENRFDGDYYKAKWAESGILEADCLMCHLPGYDKKACDAQKDQWNLRWSAGAGAGFTRVTGSVKKGEVPAVVYDRSRFDGKGRPALVLAPEPDPRICLTCHGETDWKKKGEVYMPRKDVHLRAGLRCVDCHPAGSRASDPRINQQEMHQFAKGDDPGTLVRDDLDDTMDGCLECHEKRTYGAPLPRHPNLPPDHLETISCQACHIPWRYGKAVLVQDSSVVNPLPRHPGTGKKIWTFYGPDAALYNYYGEKALFRAENQPTDPYRPQLARYKGKIYPVNRVYSLWIGIEEPGKPLDMVYMQDLRGMWGAFQKDPSSYPKLTEIQDDNGDGVVEVNRPEEINGLIESVTAWFEAKKKPLDGKCIVFVDGRRVYRSGTDSYEVDAYPYEYTPFASVHKYAHGVQPAGAALGSGGCTDCHSKDSHFFFGPVMKRPFGSDGKPQWQPQYEVLGLSGTLSALGAFREERVKPAAFFLALLAGALVLLWVLSAILWTALFRSTSSGPEVPGRFRTAQGGMILVLFTSVIALGADAVLSEYILVSRRFLESTHALFAVTVLLAAAAALARLGATREKEKGFRGLDPALRVLLAAGSLAIVISGGTMFLKSGLGIVFPFAGWVRISYTLFDAGVLAALAGLVLFLSREAWILPLRFARKDAATMSIKA